MKLRSHSALLSGAATVLWVTGASASALQSQPVDQTKIDALQQQIQDLSTQVQDLKASTAGQYADVQRVESERVKVSLKNGRPTFSTADGDFTASIRALAQLDWGTYFSQSKAASAYPAAYGPSLANGANFRRVYLGLQGKLFKDWSYNLNFDFGGSSGTEGSGKIQSVYLEYDGLAPFAIRAGAFPPPANIEDGTSSPDTIFLERNAPSDLQRSLAGGDGRDAITLLYTDDDLFGALSFTGNKVQDTASFGEQLGLVGRISETVYKDSDSRLIVGVNGTHVIKPAGGLGHNVALLGQTNGTAKSVFSLSDPPEATFDNTGTKFANTGNLSANHVTQWGVETAGAFRNFYGQAGYYRFNVDRGAQAYAIFTASGVSSPQLIHPSNDSFEGWYAQASWVLTGESRSYNSANGAFTPPKPDKPFSFDGDGWGALELAGRFSDLNLNDNISNTANVVTAWSGANKTYTYYNTARGGDQRVYSAALNWYPNSAVKLALDYEYVVVSKLQSGASVSSTIAVGPTAGVPVLPALSASQDLQLIAIRAQLSL